MNVFNEKSQYPETVCFKEFNPLTIGCFKDKYKIIRDIYFNGNKKQVLLSNACTVTHKRFYGPLSHLVKKNDKERNIQAGQNHFRKGEYENAIQCLNKALKYFPTDSSIHSELEKIKQADKRFEKYVDAIIANHKFYYTGSFGNNVFLSMPILKLSDFNNSFFACERKRNRINWFDPSGKFVGIIEEGFCMPYGMEVDERGRLWICDTDNKRLVIFNSNNQLNKIIEMSGFNQARYSEYKPLFVSIIHGRAYLIVVNSINDQFSIVSFNVSSHEVLKEEVELENFKSPANMVVSKGIIYTACSKSGIFVAYNIKTKEFKRIKTELNIVPFKRFTKTDGAFFISAGTYLIKISNDGTFVFSVDFKHVQGLENLKPGALAVGKKDNKELLYLFDKTNYCIHTIEI